MAPKTQSGLPDTHQRLLAAAARVFARDGLAGATTRVIAQEADVNEVTLFRHFQTKEKLIAAVVGQNFGPEAGPVDLPSPTADLRGDLHALGGRYESLLQHNWPLVRTMLGEMHNHLNESHEKQVFRAIFLPLKEAVLQRVEAAQHAGDLRSDRRADLLADLFLGAIFSGVLRRSMPHLKIAYPATAYLEAAVDQFLDGARRSPHS
ncbi:MAG TPA: TetR/AcrR family transcriptional regulator [Candidatus Didemnitutus sp.]|nr:TetR/AcrR family transcriptional regulator [Candidatus Didemnitutus sp.]